MGRSHRSPVPSDAVPRSASGWLWLAAALLAAAGEGCSKSPPTPKEVLAQKRGELSLDLGGGVTMKLALIPAGRFMMGSTTRFSFGDDDEGLAQYAWYDTNSGGSAHPAGQKKPNAWGLYDIHGNVCEWCADWYVDSYAGGATEDPGGPTSGSCRVLRGGSWFFSPEHCRSAFRVGYDPVERIDDWGLRVVAALD